MKSTVQRIKVKGDKPKRPEPAREMVYLVVRISLTNLGQQESIVGCYKHKAVADFRANGALMFAPQSNTDRFIVREQPMFIEETIEAFVQNWLGRGA